MKSIKQSSEIFKSADIYLVISSEFTLGRSVVDVFAEAAAAGTGIIQLREKHKSKKFLYDTAVACRQIAEKYNTLLIIDDEIDIALAAGADGVHLGQEDLPVAEARRIAPQLFYGVSTHNTAEAVAAEKEGANYINIGPIYRTGTKELAMPPLGVGAIKEISALVNLPFSVMGGIKEDKFGELITGGAKVLAMVTEITTAPDISAKVQSLKSVYNKFR
jgi:thiamine-phosphate pyrophosphorylase